jgi:integrase
VVERRNPGRGLSTKTGRSYLDALAGVLAYAQDLGILEANPIRDFRDSLRRRAHSKRGRAESEAGRQVRPIEQPAEIEALIASAQEEGLVPWVLALTLLDAGLRLGEALGLRWGRIAWGRDEDDLCRALIIDGNRPRGGTLTDPKSGRVRRVALSRRLCFALADLYHARFKPGPDVLVFAGLEPGNFRHHEWRRILERAGIGHRALKDLRDTFATQLLTAGVQLGYVSQQLGHADVAVTARHYARWAGGDMYRQPMTLATGEVPADLLGRLMAAAPPTVPPLHAVLTPTNSQLLDLAMELGVSDGDRTRDLQGHNLAL